MSGMDDIDIIREFEAENDQLREFVRYVAECDELTEIGAKAVALDACVRRAKALNQVQISPSDAKDLDKEQT